MSPLDIGSVVVGAVGVAAAAWFYYHLWKWARDCQQATIVIAYKRKVVMSPTLVELMLWSRKVPDKQNGQVFYKAANVTVAIVKREPRKLRIRRAKPAAQAQAQQGTWTGRQDAPQLPQ